MNAKLNSNLDRQKYLGGSDVAGIAGRPGYLITRSGEVFSERSGKFLKQCETFRGYMHVKLGAGRWYSIHRLVAEAFIENLLNKPQVNHIDGNPKNNAAENLEWVTQSENQLHAYSTGLQSPPIWTEESKEKMASKHRGRTCTDEQRARMSAARKGKGRGPKSAEHIEKIRIALKRRKENAA